MNSEELNRYANNLAEMSLENGFDKDAYILKVLSEMWLKSNGKEIDLIPDSKIDETIQQMLNDFVSYYNTGDIESLRSFLVKTRNIISEIYHISNSDECRNLVKRMIKSLSSIS